MLLIYTYLVNLYIRPQDWIQFFYGWPVDYLVIIPALLIGYFSLKSGKKRLVDIPHYKLLTALLLIIFLSDVSNGYMDLGISEFTLFFKRICIFLIVILLVTATNNLRRTMFFIVLLSSFIASQALYQFISGGAGLAGQDFYHSGEGVRTKWVGLWNGANVMALLLNISVPFALEFAFGPYKKGFKFLNLLLALCLIGGVYTTNSRGGFVTLLAILFLFPLFKMKKKKNALIIGAVFAGIVFIFLAPTRMSEVNSQEESAYVRTRLWGHAIEMFRENPLLGIGKGRFAEVAGRNLLAHSNYMQNLGETGGLGFFVWISLIYFTFKGLYPVFNRETIPGSRDETLKSLGRALLISFAGFNICTIFVTMEIDIFYLLLGLSAAAINIMNREGNPVKIEFTFKDVRNIAVIMAIIVVFYRLQVKG